MISESEAWSRTMDRREQEAYDKAFQALKTGDQAIAGIYIFTLAEAEWFHRNYPVTAEKFEAHRLELQKLRAHSESGKSVYAKIPQISQGFFDEALEFAKMIKERKAINTTTNI